MASPAGFVTVTALRCFPGSLKPALSLSQRLQLCVGRGNGPWHAHQVAGPPPDTMPQNRLPVHGAVWEAGRQSGGLRTSASRSLPGLVYQQGRPALCAPIECSPLWTASSRPRNAELSASREGRPRQPTGAAASLGVILAWFVLGQMAEPNGLLARLSRILFILRPPLPGKQQVVAQTLLWNQKTAG